MSNEAASRIYILKNPAGTFAAIVKKEVEFVGAWPSHDQIEKWGHVIWRDDVAYLEIGERDYDGDWIGDEPEIFEIGDRYKGIDLGAVQDKLEAFIEAEGAEA